MSTNDEDDGVLSRWSKRKRAVVEEAEATESSPESETEISEERQAELLANREAAESIDLDTIDGDSDLSLFMKDGVPEALKRKALSVLWRSNPVFANLDGLNDYDENFADPDLIMKSFTSAYQVGRGYLKEIAEETEEDVPVATEVSDDDLPENITAEAQSDEGDPEPSEELPDEEVVMEEVETEPRDLQGHDAPQKVSLRSRLNLDG